MDDCRILMGGGMADLVWTDPPYNVDYESKLAGKIKNDKMGDKAFSEFLKKVHACLFEFSKPGASIYVAHADTEGFNFRNSFLSAGFKLAGCLVWLKESFVLGRSDYHWIHEPILYGWKPGAAHRWFGGRKQSTLLKSQHKAITQVAPDEWHVKSGDEVLIVRGADVTIEESPLSTIHESKPKRSSEHPTMKPVALIERMLLNSSKVGDLVLDLFGGSGSTMIACEKNGRASCLMELDPKFCDVIVKRWEEFSGKKAVKL
jgi:DNA modification methylase